MGCCDQPGLMPLDEGLSLLLELVSANQHTEFVDLQSSLHRVCATEVRSHCNAPSFDNSAMDGYAVSSQHFRLNQPMEVQGKSFAGLPFKSEFEPTKAIRIMTGAAVPQGADAVIMQENATVNHDGSVQFSQAPSAGQNIRCIGEDIEHDQIIVAPLTHLKPPHIALMASAGVDRVSVFTKTKVGIISTGSELKNPGQPLKFGEIYNSNGPSIKAMLSHLDVDIIDYGMIEDDLEQIKQAFAIADAECDFVITSGGVSVGEADYIKDVLEQMGRVDFWKLAIKPGKPFAFGQLPNSYFIGLPGNPVSAAVTFHILGAQAIRQHQNIGYKPMKVLPAIAANSFKKAPGRMDFQRGIWSVGEEGVEVKTATVAQGSHILSSMADANCYIALEQDRGSVNAGEVVNLWLFDEVMS
ncbi:molybdopterin molybdotransferase MoeA [Reinekea marina]|uniref:Molybdopterin molybdenumtransferase n=1 Tax=Reinekea marina TaxID=1310421 RepID=A0ABV7WV98_9GAMM|nr:gephyrin-like molybdotransferase Glp [Reinekea marina]MDN3648782.1 molybdopterin molybdotransferase MoeA [Reinekea marina]